MTRLLARLIAPATLVAVALVVYLIVSGNVDGGTHHAHPRHASTHRRHRTDRSRGGAGHVVRYYTVRAGDTLSAIAGRTGVSIAQLTSLNPSLSPPYSLQAGERLRLRR